MPLGVVGVDREASAVVLDRFRPLALLLEQDPEVRIRLDQVGIRRDRVPVVTDGLGSIAPGIEQVAEVEVRDGEVGAGLEGETIMTDGTTKKTNDENIATLTADELTRYIEVLQEVMKSRIRTLRALQRARAAEEEAKEGGNPCDS